MDGRRVSRASQLRVPSLPCGSFIARVEGPRKVRKAAARRHTPGATLFYARAWCVCMCVRACVCMHQGVRARERERAWVCVWWWWWWWGGTRLHPGSALRIFDQPVDKLAALWRGAAPRTTHHRTRRHKHRRQHCSNPMSCCARCPRGSGCAARGAAGPRLPGATAMPRQPAHIINALGTHARPHTRAWAGR